MNTEKQVERDELRIKRPIIAEIGEKHLSQTALVKEKDWNRADVDAVRSFLVEAAPFAHEKILPSYWDHLVLTAEYAKYFANQINDVKFDEQEMQALAYLHDCGTLLSPRYFLKDILGTLFEKEIGIRDVDKMPPIAEILGRNKPIKSIHDLTPSQILLDVADNLGKLNENGSLLTFEDFKEHAASQSQRYEGSVWAIEKFSLGALGKGKQQLAIDLFMQEVAWLKEHGVDFDKAQKQVLAQYRSDDNQEWILKAKESQQTLDPIVDKVLNRPGVKTIIFDLGGVLIEDADPALVDSISSRLNVDKDQVVKAFSKFSLQSMADEISEEEYLKKFYTAIGKEFPESIEEARTPFINPQIYISMKGMREIVDSLSRNPNIKIVILSNHSILRSPTVRSRAGVIPASF